MKRSVRKAKGKHGGWRPGAGRKGRPKKGYQWLIYVIHEAEDPAVCKIGITSVSAKVRLGGLQVGNWRRLVLAASINLESKRIAAAIENSVRNKLSSALVGGEWFRVNLQDALRAIGQAMVEAAIEADQPAQIALFDLK